MFVISLHVMLFLIIHLFFLEDVSEIAKVNLLIGSKAAFHNVFGHVSYGSYNETSLMC
jgi:hypothetical protein